MVRPTGPAVVVAEVEFHIRPVMFRLAFPARGERSRARGNGRDR